VLYRDEDEKEKPMEQPDLSAYEQAVLKRICDACVDRKHDGDCGLDPSLECAIRVHLPELLKTVQAVPSDRMDDHVASLRGNVCAICEQGEPDECEAPEKVECPMDRYLVLMVEAIQEVQRGGEDSGPS
jgi:hypothetical protein